MNRRSFLRRASGIVAAAACALYIPSDRLEFGVPKPIATAPYGYVLDPLTGEITKLDPPPYTIMPMIQQSDDGEHWRDIAMMEPGKPVMLQPSSGYLRTMTIIPSSAMPTCSPLISPVQVVGAHRLVRLSMGG